MRRTVLAVATLVIAAGGLPGATAAKAPPAVTAITPILGVGSVSMDVTVPKGVSLLAFPALPAGPQPGFAGLFTTGKHAAVAIVAKTAKHNGAPVSAAQVWTDMPDHCPSTLAPTVGAVPKCDTFVEHTAFNAPPPVRTKSYDQHPLPAGQYQIIVSAAPGEVVFGMLQFSGVPIPRRLRVTETRRAVRAGFVRTRTQDLAVAHSTLTTPLALTGSGLGVVGLWHADAGPEEGVWSYAACVDATAAPDPGACAPGAAAGAAAPGVVPRAPFAAAATGPARAGVGTATYLTPLLRKGTYTATARVTRAARGPATGAFLWWVQPTGM